MLKSTTKIFAVVGGCGFLLGCGSTGTMEIPKLAEPTISSSDTEQLFPTGKHDRGKRDKATMRLEKVISGLDRGKVIAHFPREKKLIAGFGAFCNHRIRGADAKIEWGRGTTFFGNWQTEFGKIFFDVMSRAGHNVAGNPERLFAVREDAKAAELLVGGRISDMRANYCQNHHWWDGRPLQQYKGETYLEIEWEVFSALRRQVVYKTKTAGFGNVKQFKRQGLTLSFHDAFADAAARFAADEGLRRITERRRGLQTKNDLKKIMLGGQSLFRKKLSDNTEKIVNAVVTIQLGAGHGSGFVISSDGYLLTNAHVVGEGKRVPVLFNNGLRVTGDVVRVSKQRDVALIKIPVQSRHVLPIDRAKKVKQFEQVFVIGTPSHVELESTVTRGIVSAFRKDPDGNTFIQSDAAISGGNSGGPMIDSSGNVVGIAVESYVLGSDLNLFIPIDEALKALNINIIID